MPKNPMAGSRLTMEHVCMVIEGKIEEGKRTIVNGMKLAMA
jgi:hypothetical protein